jgi:U6 snRNA-associated Sm-like protein LSm4
MNINLREVICTSKVSVRIKKWRKFANKVTSIFQDGDKFWRMNECYIRGSTIKYLRIPDEVIDLVKEDIQAKAKNRNNNQQQNRNNNNQQNRNFGGKGNNNNRPNQNRNRNMNMNMGQKPQ